MAYGIEFDATNVDPNDTFDPVPAGDYEVIMTKDERKESENNKGNFYVNCTYKIVSGPFAGRLLFDMLFLEYQKPDTARNARARLSSICNATGIMKINDICHLYNAPLMAKVVLEKYQGDDKNKIKKFFKKPSSLQSKPEETQKVGANPAEGAEEKPAWQK